MYNLLEILLQQVEKVPFRTALESLGKKMPAFGKNFNSKMRRHFAKMHGADMVRTLMTRRWRRHVGDHQVGGAAEGIHQQARRRIVEEIHLQEMNPTDSVHLQEVDRHHPDIVIGRIGHPRGDLRPSAGSSAKVDDALGALEDM